MTEYISNSAHYTTVLSHVTAVKQTLWIGTTDIKGPNGKLISERLILQLIIKQYSEKNILISILCFVGKSVFLQR